MTRVSVHGDSKQRKLGTEQVLCTSLSLDAQYIAECKIALAAGRRVSGASLGLRRLLHHREGWALCTNRTTIQKAAAAAAAKRKKTSKNVRLRQNKTKRHPNPQSLSRNTPKVSKEIWKKIKTKKIKKKEVSRKSPKFQNSEGFGF